MNKFTLAIITVIVIISLMMMSTFTINRKIDSFTNKLHNVQSLLDSLESRTDSTVYKVNFTVNDTTQGYYLHLHPTNDLITNPSVFLRQAKNQLKLSDQDKLTISATIFGQQ